MKPEKKKLIHEMETAESDLVVIFTYDLPRIDASLGSLSPFQLSH